MLSEGHTLLSSWEGLKIGYQNTSLRFDKVRTILLVEGIISPGHCNLQPSKLSEVGALKLK